jgi:hypothetical protein
MEFFFFFIKLGTVTISQTNIDDMMYNEAIFVLLPFHITYFSINK